MRESSVAMAWSGLLQVVSGVLTSFPSRAGTGELPSRSIRSSWAWGKIAHEFGFRMRKKARREWWRGLVGNSCRFHLLLGC
jgi:hypothetical protein